MVLLNNYIFCVRDRIREQHKDFYEAFKKYDRRSKGYLTVSDIQRLLVDCHYFLDDDQLYDLLQRSVSLPLILIFSNQDVIAISFRIKLSGKSSRMTYEHFVHVFEEGRAEAYAPKPEDAAHPATVSQEKLAKLSPEKAEAKLRAMIEPQIEILQSVRTAIT